MLIHRTLRMQSWGFVIGSALFALGSAPYLSAVFGGHARERLLLRGILVLHRSRVPTANVESTGHRRRRRPSRGPRAVAGCRSPATRDDPVQHQHRLRTPRPHRERGDAPGLESERGSSIAFLVSSALAVLILFRAGTYWAPKSRDWQSVWLNTLGSIAFGISAVGAFVLHHGTSLDPNLANVHVRRRSVLPPGVCSLPRSQEIGAGAAPGVVIPRCPSRFRRDSVRRAIIEATADVPGKYPFETTNQAAHAA